MIERLATASYVGLWLVVVIQAIVLLELLRQIGILRQRMPPEPGALLTDEGLPRGATAPSFTVHDVETGAIIPHLRDRSRMTLLVFLSPSCAGCHALAPELRRFARDYEKEIAVAVVCPGSSEECAQYRRRYALEFPVVADPDHAISRSFKVQRTPSATMIDDLGRVRIHGIPNNRQHLEGLLEEEGTLMTGDWILEGREEVTSGAVRG